MTRHIFDDAMMEVLKTIGYFKTASRVEILFELNAFEKEEQRLLDTCIALLESKGLIQFDKLSQKWSMV